jgi:YidC/Oxa1 family membrane protein insertase
MGLEKPVLYIDLPPKSRNDSWRELGIEPFEVLVRAELGALLPPERIEEAPAVIRRLVADPARVRAQAATLRRDWMHNLGRSGPAAAEAVADIADELAAAAGVAGAGRR